MNKVLIIAEAGVNHNGSFDEALKLVDAAVNANADIIKFQTFSADRIVTTTAPKAEYQKQSNIDYEPQYQMLKNLELSGKDFAEIKQYCDIRGIEFMSTAFDIQSLEFLLDLGIKRIKIPSGEITNPQLLRFISKQNKEVILSTGMSRIGEIDTALSILISNGLTTNDISILHCNSAYPTPYEDVNLLAMKTIKSTFKTKIGFSDHTLGTEVAISAVALGANIIEKHFTLDRNLPGPDHISSLEVDELKYMVNAIRRVEKALGDSVKHVTRSEENTLKVARKVIVATKKINDGEIFSDQNLAAKRSNNGLSAVYWDMLIGQKSNKTYNEGDSIILFPK
jgi:N,N'-diacetyllegionaminate synthase